MITIKEAKKRIKKIESMSGDDEAAHIAEDNLYQDFVIDISKRKDKLGKIARIILTSIDMPFERWYV